MPTANPKRRRAALQQLAFAELRRLRGAAEQPPATPARRSDAAEIARIADEMLGAPGKRESA